MRPAAGYTARLVPAITSRSALAMARTAAVTVPSSNGSSYSTTSGFTMAPHFEQCGTPSGLCSRRASSFSTV